jgi:hypothetical protein
MKKLIWMCGAFMATMAMNAQSEELSGMEGLFETGGTDVFSPSPMIGPTSELGIIQKSLDDMFDFEIMDIGLPQGIQDNPPPPVPLDGGLTALLLAGGAAGYRQYKKKRA